MTINLLTEDIATVGERTAVELRKMGAALNIPGAAKGRKADLITAIMALVVEAKRVEDEKIAEQALAEDRAKASAKPVSAKPKMGICGDCGRKASKHHSTLCDACLEYAEAENTHSDQGHEISAEDGCPVCHSELDPRTPKTNRKSRMGMVIVAKGSEIHKSLTFKEAAEAVGWTVEIERHEVEVDEFRYYATATKGTEVISLAWNGRAYDYPNSGAVLNGKDRKVRNLKEALRLL